jgi:hypothetical protein
MHEEIRYPVCPHRNVAAAFQRFIGPDSGGLERFFPDERMQRVDCTLLIVRQRREAIAGALAQSLDALNVALSDTWSGAARTSWTFALASRDDLVRLIARTATLLFGARPARLPA